MPNLVDLPYGLYLHLLLFLGYPSCGMLRATNTSFRSFSHRTELICDKLIQLELDSAEGQTILAEQGLRPSHWYSPHTFSNIGPGILLPLNHFMERSELMTSVPEFSHAKNMQSSRACIECMAKAYKRCYEFAKGSSNQANALAHLGLCYVGGDCWHCRRRLEYIVGGLSCLQMRFADGTCHCFSQSGITTGRRISGYCWACLGGPRPDSKSRVVAVGTDQNAYDVSKSRGAL